MACQFFWKNSVLMWSDSSDDGHLTKYFWSRTKIWETVLTILQQVLCVTWLWFCEPTLLWKLFVRKKPTKMHNFWMGVRKTEFCLSEPCWYRRIRSTSDRSPFSEKPKTILEQKRKIWGNLCFRIFRAFMLLMFVPNHLPQGNN